MTLRLGTIMSHPTQYHAPWFRELASLAELELEVLYCFQPNATQQGAGFGVPFEWDVSLLDGYKYRFLKNVSRRPGFEFNGCDTPEIGHVLDSSKCDVFLINGWNVHSYWQAMRASWARRLPMMIRGDSHLRKSRSLATRTVKRLTLGKWIPRFDAYLTVGELNSRFYEHYGAEPARLFAVSHFVDNDWFSNGARAALSRRDEIYRKWSLPERTLISVFAGKFIDVKRPMDAINAIERCAGAAVHLLMVGDGPLRDFCERYALERHLPVSFTGFLNQREIPSAYAVADVLLLPSTTETWGLVVNEAMACGVPAIVSDQVGCAPDLIKEGSTGYTFPMGDTAALAARIRAYAMNPELAAAHGKNARTNVQRYNRISAAVNTLNAARSSIGRRSEIAGVMSGR